MSNLDQTAVLPSPPEDNEPVDAGTQGVHRWRPGRRSLILNGVIGVALLVVVALIVWTVRGTGSEPVAAAQTVSVGTGDVTATVSANGNVSPGSTANVDFQGSGGLVTDILVKPGAKVRKGRVLATVDATAAKQSLASARVQLAAAEAAYDTTTQGQTSAEYQRDERSIDQSQVSLQTARTNVRSARRSLSLTRSQQNASVKRAEDSEQNARDALATARATYQGDPTTENQQAVTTAESAVSSAKTAVALAKEGRATALFQGREQVTSARQQERAARASLSSAEASAAVNRQGATSGAVAQAQAQVDAARITVEEAQTALDHTKLRAPVAGRVAQINGTVGESSTVGSSTSGTTSSTSTTDTSGFVVLTDTNALQVSADVAEADIADIEVGQEATITLSASSAEIAGTVTAVDAIETVTNNVVEYGVTVTLSDTKGVKLGQSTQVVITTGSQPGALRVSSSALTTIGQRTTATVQDGGSTRVVEVVTGLEGDGFTEVLSGLSEGDVVELPAQTAGGTEFTFPGRGGLGGGLP